MANLAASAIVLLSDVNKPRVEGGESRFVEEWQITADGAATTVPITSAFGNSIITGSLAGCSYVLSGTNNTTITFAPTAATDLVNTKVYRATLITKPVGT